MFTLLSDSFIFSDAFYTFLTIIYVIVCVFLIGVVLLQSGKGGGLGAIGGAAASTAGQQIFGGAGAASVLTKLTSIFAALFMILSATLAYLPTHGDDALDTAAERLNVFGDPAISGDDATSEAEPPEEAAEEEVEVEEVEVEEPIEESAEAVGDSVEALAAELDEAIDGAELELETTEEATPAPAPAEAEAPAEAPAPTEAPAPAEAPAE